MEYVYLGDRLTSPDWRGLPVNAVRRADGKCITGKRATMLVEDAHGRRCVVLRRLLVKRKV